MRLTLLLLLFSPALQAQTYITPAPNFYEQMQAYKALYQTERIAHDSTRTLLDSSRSVLRQTREVSARLLTAKDARIAQAVGEGNDKLAAMQRANDKLATRNETLAAGLDECGSRLETTTTELRKLQPKTWAGRQLRKAGKAAQVVGWGTLIYVGLRLAL